MSRTKTIALITIGQTPRTDIVSDFTALWGNAFTIAEYGALDGLTAEEIRSLAPAPGEHDLITRLQDGSSVLVSHDRLVSYMQKAVERATAGGMDIGIIQCTGEFAGLTAENPLLYPCDILENSVSSLISKGQSVIVIVPTPGQAPDAEERWQSRGYKVAKTIVASPFVGGEELLKTIQEVGELSAVAGIIADCYGFSNNFYDSVSKFYDKPVFIPRRLIAHLLLSVLAKA